MASPLGRGAQVRLNAEQQAAARGAVGTTLAGNILAKQRVEDRGDFADGTEPDARPRPGVYALDEVLTPGGLLTGLGGPPVVIPPDPLPPGTLIGHLAGQLAIRFATSGTINGRTDGGGVIVIPPIPGTITGVMRGSIATSFTLSGAATGVIPVLDSINDRANIAIMLRDGSTLMQRPFIAVPGPDAITDRASVAIGLRDGGTLEMRRVPDPVVIVPPPVVVFPPGPYLKAVPIDAGMIVLAQNGETIHLRMVRPVWPATSLVNIIPQNTTAYAENFYFSWQYGIFGAHNGQLIVERELTPADDGSYAFQLFRNMSNNTTLVVEMIVTISDTADEVNPQPKPLPVGPQIFFEPFTPGRGTGALIKTWWWQRLVTTAQGTLLLDGSDKILQPDGSFDIPGCSAMTMVSPNGINSADYGFGNGLFEFRAKFYGDNIGERSGPAIILWPADDVWPGTEIDLGELMGDGTFYMAIHWKENDGSALGQDRALIFAAVDNPIIGPGFNHRDWHTYAARLATDRIILYIDGLVLASNTSNPAPDFAHGGVNHTVGLQNGSSTTKLECDWIRWTPESLLPVLLPVIPIGTKRGRPVISGNTVKTDQGTLMRGATMALDAAWKSTGSNSGMARNFGLNRANWVLLRDLGTNCVRVDVPLSLDGMTLNDQKVAIDTLVANAAATGMYIILMNSTATGSWDENELIEFYNWAAPRFKDETHVFFEVTNEPAYDAASYGNDLVAMMARMYGRIHTMAPNSLIGMMDFAAIGSGADIVAKCNQATALGVQWGQVGKAFVAFHIYWTDEASTTSALNTMKAAFPCMMTEIQGVGQWPPDIDRIAWLEQRSISWTHIAGRWGAITAADGGPIGASVEHLRDNIITELHTRGFNWTNDAR